MPTASQRIRSNIYDHPTSERFRTDRAADERGSGADPIRQMRDGHRDAKTTLAAKHRDEGLALHQKHQRARQADPMMLAGHAASPDLKHKEQRETWHLQARHTMERDKLGHRHAREIEAAQEQREAAQKR
jgi:hypothetical protein